MTGFRFELPEERRRQILRYDESLADIHRHHHRVSDSFRLTGVPFSIAFSEELLVSLAEFCDEFLVHAVDVEGKMCGIQEELVVLLARYSPILVTYAGGARSLVRRDDDGRPHLTHI